MIEKYLTVLSIIIILRVIFSYPYYFVLRRTKFANKSGKLFLTKFFAISELSWILFWLATLWLIVYFYDFLINFFMFFKELLNV